jgi:DNA-nicking Smr family endonuclease
LNKKISDKDKKDWENFLSNKEKVLDKEIYFKNSTNKETVKKIDLHGLSLENANRTIDGFINKCFQKKVAKIIVITGKGLRSDNASNPYVSKDLSILKYSVPEFIESNIDLMKMIYKITDAKIEDGGSGAFYIYLKKTRE